MADKNFNIYTITRKTFDIVINTFIVSSSWILSITQKNVVSFITEQTKKMFSTISQINRVSISLPHFYEYLSQNIEQKLNVFVLWRENQGFSITKSSKTNLSYILRQRLRFSLGFSGTNFLSSFEPLVANFIKIEVWDVETLGTLDTNTIEEMDYVVT